MFLFAKKYKLIQKDVITKVGYKPGQIVSSIIFLRPAKDGVYRLIYLNLRVSPQVHHAGLLHAISPISVKLCQFKGSTPKLQKTN